MNINGGACNVIRHVEHSDFGSYIYIRNFKSWFMSRNRTTYWWGFDERGMNARIIALLLMEQIEKDLD